MLCGERVGPVSALQSAHGGAEGEGGGGEEEQRNEEGRENEVRGREGGRGREREGRERGRERGCRDMYMFYIYVVSLDKSETTHLYRHISIYDYSFSFFLIYMCMY